MAEFIDSLSIIQLIFITYFMRICDVSLNTIKTISVVQGRIAMAVVLGFFEVLIWVTVVSQVITRLGDYPILGVAYAAGYATGNAVGIVIDRFMALGTSVVRFISQHQGYSVADALRSSGQPVTTFDGEGRDGHCLLMYAICPANYQNGPVRRPEHLLSRRGSLPGQNAENRRRKTTKFVVNLGKKEIMRDGFDSW